MCSLQFSVCGLVYMLCVYVCTTKIFFSETGHSITHILVRFLFKCEIGFTIISYRNRNGKVCSHSTKAHGGHAKIFLIAV